MKMKMENSEDIFDSAVEKALQSTSQLGISRELRAQQTKAIYTLVSEGDLLAVLPTGFGKSLILKLLVRVKELLTGKTSSVIVAAHSFSSAG